MSGRARWPSSARRYLAGHGPASAPDLALWAGLPLRDAVTGLEGAAASLRDVGGGLVDLTERRRPASKPPPRLLPAFDAYLLGWRDRHYAVPAERASEVRLGGIIRAVALVDGVAVGTWATRRAGRRMAVDVEWWDEVGEPARAALAAEAADVVRFEVGI